VKDERQIRDRIAAIEADERMSYKPANVMVNAPLALIQVEGKAVSQALLWVLDEASYCAGSYPDRTPR